MSRSKTILTPVLAVVFWLLTIVICIVDVYYVREVFFKIYARFSTNSAVAATIGDLLIVLAALGALAFIIATSEYHRTHFPQHKCWDVFAWSLVALLTIPFLATVVL